MTAAPDELKTAVIIEDDPEIRQILAEVLEAAGFTTVSVGNGIDGVKAVLAHQPVLTTLDVTMPGIDGFEAAKRIRAQSDTFIIMLTGLNEEADIIAGLGAGADDYLQKPFRPRELRARVDAMLRRSRETTGNAGGMTSTSSPPRDSVGPSFPAARASTAPSSTASDQPAQADVSEAAARTGDTWTLHDGDVPSDATDLANDADTMSAGEWLSHRDLRLHPEYRVAVAGEEELDLTRTEFDLLATLLESKRRVRSKADLTLVLRGESYVTSYFVGDADKRAVEAHMTNLRRKLGDNAANPLYIETVRGVGYRLTSETA